MLRKAKLQLTVIALLLGLINNSSLQAQMTLDKIIIDPNQKVAGVLASMRSQSPTNAEQVLGLLSQAIADMTKQKTFTDSLASLDIFLNWLAPRVSPSKGDDTLLSKTPYFNKTNLMALFLTMETIKIFLKTKMTADQVKVDDRFNSFNNVINAKTNIGLIPQIEEPSIVEKGIFKKNAIKFTADFFGARISLTTATNARDVLTKVANLYADLNYSMSRTYVNFEGFRYSTNASTIAFVQNNTKGLLESVTAFLTKLMSNVSVNENDAKWYSKTPYFNRGDISVLTSLVKAIEHFCTEKMCTDRNKTRQLFQQFYSKFPI